MYKLQLENAQKEIFRAQEVLSTVEQQRHEAEEDAARSRSTARALKEEKLVQMAREEGRRMGMEEGMERGRDLGYKEGRAVGYEQGRSRAEHVMERFLYDADMTMGMGVADDETPLGSPISRSVPATPRHMNVPPDNWIPEQDIDAVIRLPPPHEMNRPVMTHSPSPSPPLPPLPEIAEEDEDEDRSESPIMIPAPQTTIPMHQTDTRYGRSDAPRNPGSSRHRRRSSSPGSEISTQTSDLELLSAPHQYMQRGFSGERLSVIQEANTEGTPSQRTMKTASTTPATQRQPSIRERDNVSVYMYVFLII